MPLDSNSHGGLIALAKKVHSQIEHFIKIQAFGRDSPSWLIPEPKYLD
jgi:hypothetical protein